LRSDYVPQAQIWRINHGWRRSADHNGFVIETNTGAWQRQSDDDDEPNGTTPRAVRVQIRPYVSDTRNLLLVRASAEEPDEDFLRTLAYSLRRAIQLDYQIEEQEIQVELIGSEKQRRIILWEAADLFLQPDFYYQRGAIPGVCVFIDGPHHAGKEVQDRRAREPLEDRGYRIVVITAKRPLAEQIETFPDIFVPLANGQW